LAFLLNKHQLFFGEENVINHNFPIVSSASFAHELLSFCLDFDIEQVFLVRAGELEALLPVKILFSEFGIDIVAPDVLSNFNENVDAVQVNNFNLLSTQLIKLGYPNQKFAIGQSNLRGNVILINDERKDFNQIWSKISDISFVQIGKLFNQTNFESLTIYPISESVQSLNVLFVNNELQMVQKVNQELFDLIFQAFIKYKMQGFYQVLISGYKILRIKNMAY
jgi:hypothetical protein